MSLATAELPTDPAELHAFALACQSELKVAELSVQYKVLEIEKLKLQIAKLRRMQFGRSSERISRQIEQLEMRLEELETGEAEAAAKAEAEADTAELAAPIRERAKPKRKPLPDHRPRQDIGQLPISGQYRAASAITPCGRSSRRGTRRRNATGRKRYSETSSTGRSGGMKMKQESCATRCDSFPRAVQWAGRADPWHGPPHGSAPCVSGKMTGAQHEAVHDRRN
jgi:hypothetical protein